MLVAALLALLALERRGLIAALAGNFTVPASWVRGADRRAGFLWGAVLGSGVLTQAPYAVFHAAVAAAVLQPSTAVAFACGLAFAAGRFVTSAAAPIRHAILAGMEHRSRSSLPLARRGRAASIAWAASASRAAVVVAGVVAAFAFAVEAAGA